MLYVPLSLFLKPERKSYILGKQGNLSTMNPTDQRAAIILNLQKENNYIISSLNFYGW